MAEPRNADTLPPLPLAILIAGATLAVASHTLWLPFWVDVIAAALLIWRAFVSIRGGALPARWLLIVLTFAGAIGVFFSYRTIMGRDPGVTLLVMLLFLKLLETRARRDVFVVAFLIYFVALANFFYSQSIPIAGLMLLTVFITTTALVGFSAPQRPVVDDLKTAGRMLAQAGPVMLLLFFLFPRVQGPLWGMPQDAYSGVTGLSETMSPGSISSLSLSDAIAFRVKFETEPPPRAQLYWRGPVLSDFDGLVWRVGLPQLRRNMSVEAAGSPVDYEVTLEPHNRNWMFALEMPARLPAAARLTSEYLVISLTPIRSRIRYEMRSFPQFQAASGGSPEDLANALRLPRGVNPRSLALASEWRESVADNSAIVRPIPAPRLIADAPVTIAVFSAKRVPAMRSSRITKFLPSSADPNCASSRITRSLTRHVFKTDSVGLPWQRRSRPTRRRLRCAQRRHRHRPDYPTAIGNISVR